MWRLLIAVVGTHLVVTVIALASLDRAWQGPGELVLATLLVPGAVAWGTLELLAQWRPRRLFQGRRRATAGLLGLGVVAGGVATALSGIAIGWLHAWIDDVVLIAMTECLAVGAAVLALPRAHGGHCVYCGFDVRAVGPGGACPECGAHARIDRQPSGARPQSSRARAYIVHAASTASRSLVPTAPSPSMSAGQLSGGDGQSPHAASRMSRSLVPTTPSPSRSGPPPIAPKRTVR